MFSFLFAPRFSFQLARVADRVRRMPLHSPLAAVLAGVELTLRKGQDWEQHAHRGVSLKDELSSLSSLVVRWRAVELKSWPQLLDAREDAFVLKVCRYLGVGPQQRRMLPCIRGGIIANFKLRGCPLRCNWGNPLVSGVHQSYCY